MRSVPNAEIPTRVRRRQPVSLIDATYCICSPTCLGCALQFKLKYETKTYGGCAPETPRRTLVRLPADERIGMFLRRI